MASIILRTRLSQILEPAKYPIQSMDSWYVIECFDYAIRKSGNLNIICRNR